MSSIFHNFMESMVETCEQMIKVIEEGTSILMGLSQGTNKEGDKPSSSFETNNDYTNDDTTFGEEEDIAGMKSPLDGIAEDVLDNIMKNQVSLLQIIICHTIVICHCTLTISILFQRLYIVGSTHVSKR